MSYGRDSNYGGGRGRSYGGDSIRSFNRGSPADPMDIEPGHTSTFDSFATEEEISGDATSFRLPFDPRCNS